MEAQQPIERDRDKRFALLIDADNVSAKYIKPILNELNKYGTVTYKRIYGDWTLSLHAKWKDALLENSITPIQQFSYTYGKNSTDSAMIIDAMDILYAGGVEGFCIVSSDSDFTRLASRLRESGRTVIGMGEKKTPTPFRKACDIFTVLELLVKNERNEKANGPAMSKAEVEQAVVDIIIDNQNNGKATGLGEIGSRLQKRYPDFDVRNYGTNLLSKLLSEFTRVKITKDHSSVAVELTDAAEAEKAATIEAKLETKPETARAEEIVEDSVEAAAEEPAASEAEVEAEDRKPPRRSRRSRRIRANREEAATTEEAASIEEAPSAPESETEAEAETAPQSTIETDDQTTIEATAEPEAAAASAPAKSTRKPRRRKKIEPVAEPEPVTESNIEANVSADEAEETAEEANPGNTAEPAIETSEPEPAKPARKPRRRKKAAAASEPVAEPAIVVEPAAEPELVAEPVAASEPASETATNDPAQLIRNAIVNAGPEGIALTKLGEDIRVAFKDFKVRDLGFPQLRLYIASIDDFEIIKDGKAFLAKLRD